MAATLTQQIDWQISALSANKARIEAQIMALQQRKATLTPEDEAAYAGLRSKALVADNIVWSM